MATAKHRPARDLVARVHVHTPDAGVVVYAPGDEVPDGHAELITNPKAWETIPGDESDTE